jgi:hypothetical protein
MKITFKTLVRYTNVTTTYWKLIPIGITDTFKIAYSKTNSNYTLMVNTISLSEAKSKYNTQLKSGFIEIDVILNSGLSIEEYFKINILNNNGSRLPMLASKTSTIKNLTGKYGYNNKLNGIRAKIHYSGDIALTFFDEPYMNVVIVSKEGNKYYMPHIQKMMYDLFYSDIKYLNYEFDGEFYKHNAQLNDIKSCVPLIGKNGIPAKPSGNTFDLDFVMFDVIPSSISPYEERLKEFEILSVFKKAKYLQYLKTTVVNNPKAEDIITWRDTAIQNGYEGVVLRKLTSNYQYGLRNSAMIKYKKWKEKEFKIIDIVYEGKKGMIEVVKVILENDINDTRFEAIPGNKDKSWTNEEKLKMYDAKEFFIGMMGTIRYYERSGVTKVPFHANFITVRNYE